MQEQTLQWASTSWNTWNFQGG